MLSETGVIVGGGGEGYGAPQECCSNSPIATG